MCICNTVYHQWDGKLHQSLRDDLTNKVEVRQTSGAQWILPLQPRFQDKSFETLQTLKSILKNLNQSEVPKSYGRCLSCCSTNQLVLFEFRLFANVREEFRLEVVDGTVVAKSLVPTGIRQVFVHYNAPLQTCNDQFPRKIHKIFLSIFA